MSLAHTVALLVYSIPGHNIMLFQFSYHPKFYTKQWYNFILGSILGWSAANHIERRMPCLSEELNSVVLPCSHFG